MASKFDTFEYGGHGVVESTLMLATTSGGHFYNMVADVDIDNGSVMVLKPENYVEGDLFKAEAPKITDKIVLAATPVKIYAEYTKQMQEESNFYNGANEPIRAYEVYPTDRFTLSDDAFDADAVPVVGKYVVVKNGSYKLTVVDEEPKGTHGFVGYILKKASNGNYVIFVKRNQEI